MNTIDAKYFDGQSSSLQHITVLADRTINEIRLQIADGVSVIWQSENIQFEQYDKLLEIRNKKYVGAILKIEDEEFSQKFYETMKQNRRVDVHTRLLNLGFSKIMAIAVCLFGLMVFAYFNVLPTLAEKSAALLPISFDKQIGKLFMETFLNESEIDIKKTEYLQKFALELDLKNTKPLNFTVVNSDEVNAFALPNGQIVVYTAILNEMENYEELAALIGHEAAHINRRHSIKMLCRNLAGYMMISLLFSDVNGIMALVTDNVQQLRSLSYSRKFEQKADEEGLKILMENKVNPNGMIKLFEQFEKENEVTVPQIISTHPLTKKRIENMQKIISESNFEIITNNSLSSIFKHIKDYKTSQ